MTRHAYPTAIAIAVLALAGCVTDPADTPAGEPSRGDTGAIAYPPTTRGGQVDVYHGVTVTDPYRWLEDDVRESDAVREWVTAQNEVTFAYLERIPARERIEQRMTELWNYEKFGVPFREGDRYFYFYNDGLQNQSVLYTQESLDEEPRILIDPNGWSEDGTLALAGVAASPDAGLVAYGIQDGGSDWRTWRVMNVATGEVLADRVEWIKYSGVSWARDGSGFYYSRYPEPASGEEFQSLNHDHAVYFHRLGEPQSEDRLVHARPDHPDWGFNAVATEDGRYLLITVWKGTADRYRIVYVDLEAPADGAVTLIERFEHDYTYVGNDGPLFYFRTDRDAPRGRLVAIDLRRPEPSAWRELVAEDEHVLTGAGLVGGRFVLHYLRDARSQVRVHERDGSPVREIDLPGIGTASGFGGKADDPETFYSYSSFDSPPTTYRYDVASGETRLLRKADVDFDSDDYTVEQVFYRSKDGTRVPMFIAHRRDVDLDGDNPTLLYGYGGFNISQLPQFSITRLAWMEMGGVYAVANLRGGGEYGEAWHRAGTRLEKQNVFDDFIAAAEHLVDSGYTRPERLAIFGGSNGGLLVGAVANQRPELFGAAMPAVGVMDMLRFHRFTAGRFWVDDYGSADDPEEFRALYAYSPYHNIREGVAYPATLVTTADTDDRVVPGHSFKYIAALQRAHAGSAPVLIRIETRAGHGAGTPTAKIIEAYADRWAFLVENLDVRLPDDYGLAAAGG